MARPFYGIPVETLRLHLREAQDQLLKGNAVTSFGNESGNTSVQIIAHARQRIADITAELRERGEPDFLDASLAPVRESYADFSGLRCQ